MKNIKASGRIHPLMATAAASITLVCMVGVAAITGILPTSHSSAPAPVAAEVSPVPAPVAPAPVLAAAPVEAPAKVAAAEPPKAAPRASQPAPKPRSEPRPRPAQVAAAPAVCSTCGRVESVETIQKPAEGSGLGAVAGAVVGGALGNQIGGGNGKKLATVAGAIGGGFAGNAVEKRVRATTTYQVQVRMEDGSVRSFPYDADPGFKNGDRVNVINGSLSVRG